MTFTIGQRDTRPNIRSRLERGNGDLVDFGTVDTVTFVMENEFKENIIEETLDWDSANLQQEQGTSSNVSVASVESAEVTYDWQQGDTDTVGNYEAEWYVEYDTVGESESFPNHDKIEVAVVESIQ